jgi:outer membrane lipoprotein-sorting protein
MRTTILLLLLTLIFSIVTVLPAQNAKEIVQKADQHVRGNSSEAEMVMTIVRPSWERSVEMKTWSRGTPFSLILIKSPARDQGTTFLKRNNEIWNWVPAIGRTVKLPPSMMMQSWMGSDFTNDDLVRESSIVNDFTHTLAGDTEIEGMDVHIIDLHPKPDAPVVWGRVRMFISKTDYLQLRTEFYDEDDELVSFSEGKEIRVMDGRRMPTKLIMNPIDKPGHQTILEHKSIRFDADIPESFFTVQNMRRVQ